MIIIYVKHIYNCWAYKLYRNKKFKGKKIRNKENID